MIESLTIQRFEISDNNKKCIIMVTRDEISGDARYLAESVSLDVEGGSEIAREERRLFNTELCMLAAPMSPGR